MGGRLQARGGEKLPLIMAVVKASIKLHFVTPPSKPNLLCLLFPMKITYGTEQCEPGAIRESSVGSDGKHCCGGKWPKRFYLLSAEILCKSGCRSSPFYGSFPRGTRPVQVRELPPRPDDRIDRSVKNRQKAAFLLQREAGALSCCSELVYKLCAQRPCNE